MTKVTQQQYNKCQAYLRGEVKDTDMYILAQTYWSEIHILVGDERLRNDSDKNIFTEWCKTVTI